MMSAPLLTFSGFPQSVPLRRAVAYGLRDSSFTVEAWIRPDAPEGHTEVILGTDETQADQGLHLAIRNGRLYLGFYSNDLPGNTVLSAGQWVHVAFVYDRGCSEQRIYLNGVLDAARGGARPFLGNGTLHIGRCFNSQGFHGAIRELRIWCYARSAAELSGNLLLRASGTEPGLRGYFPLDERSGDVRDQKVAVVDGKLGPWAEWRNDTGVQGLYFDGTSRVEIADRPELRVLGDQSLELWVWPNKLEGEQALFGKAWGAEGALLLREDRLVYRWGIKDHNRGELGKEVQELSAGRLLSGQWNKVAVVRSFSGFPGVADPLTLSLYINGARVASERLLFGATSAGSSALPWIIGAGEGAVFFGFIKDVRLWARALDVAELHAPLGADADRDGLLGHWKLDQGGNPVSGNSSADLQKAVRADADAVSALHFTPEIVDDSQPGQIRLSLRAEDGRLLHLEDADRGRIVLNEEDNPTSAYVFVAVEDTTAVLVKVGEVISLRAVGNQNQFVGIRDFLAELMTVSSEADPQQCLFIVRPALMGGDGISFESVNLPGYFLRHQGYRIWLHRREESSVYVADASFRVVPGLCGQGDSFESVNFPGHYIRSCQKRRIVWIDNNQRGNGVFDTELEVFWEDASFRAVAPANSTLVKRSEASNVTLFESPDFQGGSKILNAGRHTRKWEPISGEGAELAVGLGGEAWVVDRKGVIRRWVNSHWMDLPGSARDVGVGKDGGAWIIGTLPGKGNGYAISRWTGQNWETMPGAAVRITVQNRDKAWVVDGVGVVHEFVGGSWVARLGLVASDVAIGADGSVWALGNDIRSQPGGASIFRWSGIGWEQVSGAGLRITVSLAGFPIIVNDRGEVFEYRRGDWTRVAERARDVGAGPDGSLWVAHVEGGISRQLAAGGLSQIRSLKVPSGMMVSLESVDGDLRVCQTDQADLKGFNGPFLSIEVGECALSPAGEQDGSTVSVGADPRNPATNNGRPDGAPAEVSLDDRVHLRAANGRFIRVLADRSLVADAEAPGPDTPFRGVLLAAEKGVSHGIIAANGDFLSGMVSGFKVSEASRLSAPVPTLRNATSSSSFLHFEGPSVVRIEPHPDLVTAGPMTVECWVRPAAAARPDYWSPVVGRHGPASGWELRCDGNVACFVYTTNQGGHIYARARYDAPESWVHIAGVYDGRILRLLINGIQEAETVASGLPVQFPGLMQIGQNAAWPDRQFLGDVQEVRLWGVARSNAEILADFRESVSPDTYALIAVWRVLSGQLQMLGPKPIGLRMEGVKPQIGGVLAGGGLIEPVAKGPAERVEDPKQVRQQRDQLQVEVDTLRSQVVKREQQQQELEASVRNMRAELDRVVGELEQARQKLAQQQATRETIEKDREREYKEILASNSELVSMEEFILRSHGEVARARAALEVAGSGIKLGKVTMDLKVALGPKGYGISFPSATDLARAGSSFSALSVDLTPPAPSEIPVAVARRPVPDLSGQTELMARRKAAEAGFMVEVGYQVLAEGSDNRHEGRVVMQLPRALELAEVGSTLSIFLGKAGEKPV